MNKISYPLHPSQLEVYYDQVMNLESPHYNVGGSVCLDGILDTEKLSIALRSYINAYDIHKMSFDFTGDEPRCTIEETEVDPELLQLDFRHFDQPEKVAGEWMQNRFNQAIQIESGRLFEFALLKVADERTIFFSRYHHLLTDAYGFTVGLKRVAANYSALVKGEDLPEITPRQFLPEVAAAAEYQSSAQYRKDRDYWVNRVGNLPEPLLPLKSASAQADRSEVIVLEITDERRTYYNHLNSEKGISTQLLTMMALHIYFGKLREDKDFILGCEMYKRRKHQWETPGMFAGILPFKTTYNPEQTLTELAEQLRAHLLRDYRHQNFPVSHINRELQLLRHKREQLFEVYVNYLLLDFNAEFYGLTSKTEDQGSEFEKVPLRFWWRDYGTQQPLELRIDYRTAYLSPAEAGNLAERVLSIMDRIGENLDKPAKTVKILTVDEEIRILQEFNNTTRAYPADKTLARLFEEQALLRPENIAAVCGNSQISYRELNTRSNQLAHYLLAQKLNSESLVGVCMDRSIEMLVAILAIFKAGGAYLPIDPEYPAQRIEYILADSRARWMITDTSRESLLPASADCILIRLDADAETIAAYPAVRPGLAIDTRQLAYLIYTSGSTGNPKGAMVEHQGMVNHLFAKINELGIDHHSRVLQNASQSFDISIWQFLVALARGGTTYIYTQDTILDSGRFLSSIAADQLTHVEVVPSYLRVLLSDKSRENLQLPDLKYLLVTGETLPKPLTTDWFNRYPAIPMVNAYGPTEASDDITHYQLVSTPNHDQVPIGHVLQNLKIYIFNKDMELCPIGIPGEIGVSGIGVGRGYLNNEELTKAKFIENPFEKTPYRLYRTGDTGYWLSNGNIIFLGRNDDQVKIRGHRIELGEIESTLLLAPGVKEGTVLAKNDGQGNKRLVAYLVATNEYSRSGLLQYLRNNLPDYMVPGLVMELETLPLTENGKINKRALPDPDPADADDAGFQPAETPDQVKLAAIWQEILGVGQVGINSHFFELGGNSLSATRLVAAIRREWSAEISIRDLFVQPTIAGLETLLAKVAERSPANAITPAGRNRRMALSFPQERLWFIDKLEGSLQYQMPFVFRAGGNVDEYLLEQAFRQLVNRHEVLRTVYEEVDGEVFQRILPAGQWRLEQTRVKAEITEEELKEKISRIVSLPFNLATDHALRVHQILTGESGSLIVVVMHHIASDGWSVPLMVKEFTEFYQAGWEERKAELPALPVQYADFAVWQRSREEEVLNLQLPYWQKQLAGIEPLNLPADFTRPQVQSTRGAEFSMDLEDGLKTNLQTLANAEGVTLFSLLLSVFKIMLHRHSGQNDICVGTPVANRSHQELEPLIGFFVNTLPLRSRLGDNPGFRELLRQVQATTLDAYANQEIPFEKIVDKLAGKRDMSRSPVFQVMFNLMQETAGIQVQLGNTKVSAEYLPLTSSKYDLTLNVMLPEKGMRLQVEYCSDLFRESSVRKMMAHFETLLYAVISQPEERINNLPMLSGSELNWLQNGLNATETPFDLEKTIIDIFEEREAASPLSDALVFRQQSLSYRELNRRASQLARYLQEMGVKSGTRVPVCAARSFEMVVAILAVLKTGAAFVPVDPDFPEDRIAYIFENSGDKLAIRYCPGRNDIPILPGIRVVDLETDQKLIEACSPAPLSGLAHASQPAYMIYTSGSTGRPKGVMVGHRSLTNFLLSMRQNLGVKPGVSLMSVTTFCFDIFYLELFLPLLAGGKVILMDRETLMDAYQLKAAMASERPQMMQAVPALWQMLLEGGWTNSEGLTALVGGEAVPDELKDALTALGHPVWNMYGPTETTIWSTMRLLKGNEKVNIGRPIANTRIYILDAWQNMAPQGTMGELCIGGAGLAHGYWGKPELTAEKFVPDPFSSAPDARMYRTGDYARWLPNGELEYLGRMDAQVKVRGYRIELGEIESVLRQFTGIRQAVVMAHGESAAGKKLVAYLVSEAGYVKEELMAYLREKLPEYMIPYVLIDLDELPLTPNGKTDRKALPDPDLSQLSTAEYVAPRNAVEEELVGIWRELLKVEKIGVYDNFFELGGHSLLVTRVVAHCRKAFQIQIPLKALFQFTCVAELSDYIRVMKASEMEIMEEETEEVTI